MYRLGVQLHFTDLEPTLGETKFLIVDVETTGTSPANCEITEIAAVTMRGGKMLDSYESLVAISGYLPSGISEMTGIYPEMLGGAPLIATAISRILEMAEGAVIVGHNIGFDIGFINAALSRISPLLRLENPLLDTVSLARKLIMGEVTNFKLGTLAAELRLDHQPSHRAMPDVLATVDLLHHLIERAGSYGVATVAELRLLPNKIAGRHLAKLRACNYLPRRNGVYWSLDGSGEVTYVGKAVDLNARFRSYFTSDTRRKVDPLLAGIHTLCYMTFESELEALLAEARLIQRLKPRFNALGKRSASDYRYIAANFSQQGIAQTKILKASAPIDSTSSAIGPFRSRRSAALAEYALRNALEVVPEAWRLRTDDKLAPKQIQAPRSASPATAIAVDAISRRLWHKLTVLSQSQLFEEAEKLRLGANYLILAMVRQFATMSLGALESFEITSNRSGKILHLHHGMTELRADDAGAILLDSPRASSRRDPSLAAALDPPLTLAPHPSDKFPALHSFEELWILWNHLVSGSDFRISDSCQVLSMPLSLAHRPFVPRGASLERRD